MIFNNDDSAIINTRQGTFEFMNLVYAFMGIALLITTVTAYYVSKIPSLALIITQKPMALVALVFFQVALVMALSFFITRISFFLACTLFFIYAISVGLTFSMVFLFYQVDSIFKTFLVTATMFFIMAFYGFFTKSDLTTIGNLAYMALIGLVVGLVVNIFFNSAQFDFLLSGFGVLIFTILIAYDTQKIKKIAQELTVEQQVSISKIALIGALTLYLDAINLFLFMLRFTGARRED